MKALLSNTAGGPETLVLADIAAPQPGPGQVSIDVHAVGVNYPDALVIQDLYQFKPPRPFAPGAEFAGTIRALGEGVTGFTPGDRVLATNYAGGMAEVALAQADRVVAIPDEMPFEDAAAFLLTYGTVFHALHDRGALQEGETLLVLGAAGGVGIAGIELGKSAGARVVAAVSSEEKAAFARSRGADEVVVYPSGDIDKAASRALAEAFKQACGPDGADVVLDPVGGAYAEPAVRTLGWKGRYLVVGFTAGIPAVPLNLTLLKGSAIVGVFWGLFNAKEPAASAANVRRLMDLYREGAARPEITERFPLERGGEAIARLASRQATGKVVVVVR
ncbi:NADPH:quinone oxidoreductase family protein [Phenylobacterium sp.]|jgi:NADPH2:quinone reductase|uniref:NADPH:quinone oxidoreductase family protein n=1 Tax=Phenylobacterium sp. TaxID=1871053 RepID=UPI0037849349